MTGSNPDPSPEIIVVNVTRQLAAPAVSQGGDGGERRKGNKARRKESNRLKFRQSEQYSCAEYREFTIVLLTGSPRVDVLISGRFFPTTTSNTPVNIRSS